MIAFADALTVTTPRGAGVPAASPALRDVFDAAGASLEYENDKGQLFIAGCSTGVCRISSRSRVDIIYASGQFLTKLREQNLYMAYLSALSLAPHRVTRIDATVDVATDAIPQLQLHTARARAGLVALSRKRIARADVREILSAALYDESMLTGSAYLGLTTAEVYLLLYDKRHERLGKGFADPGPLMRYSLVVRGGMGPTLRDAADPTALFYHFVSPDILARPSGVALWGPLAEGFTLQKLAPLSSTERMYRLLDASPDVARLVKLANELGPQGTRILAAALERMARGFAPWVARNKDARIAQQAQVVGSTGAVDAPDRLQ